MYQKRKKIVTVMLISILLCSFFLMFNLTFCEETTKAAVKYNGDDLDVSMSAILESSVVKSLKTLVVTLVNPVASIALGGTLIGLMMSKSPKQTESLLKGIKAIVWGFALSNSIGLFLSTVGNIIGNHAYTF